MHSSTTLTNSRAARGLAARVAFALAACAASSALALGQDQPTRTPPARPATPPARPGNPPSTAPTAPTATPPAGAQPAGQQTAPAHGDDAYEGLPEGMKVRAPGPKPNITGGAAIYFEELDFDFGKMTNAETKNHRFWFVNAGDQPLVLETVVAKCGCTKPKFTPESTYQPGERGYIDVDFTPTVGGHQAKAMTVKTNAKWPSDMWNIRVIAKVDSVLTFQPIFFDFGEIRRGTPFEKVIPVKADASSTIFDSVLAQSSAITATFLGDAPHTGQVDLKIAVSDKAAWGPFRVGNLRVNVRGRTEEGADITKTLPLRITGTIVDEIRADKYFLQFGTIRPGSPFSGSIFVFHEEGKDFELTNPTFEPMDPTMRGVAQAQYAPLAVKKETRDGKPGYLLTLGGTTGNPTTGFLSGTMKFTTKSPGATESVARELPINGRVLTEEQEKNLPSVPARGGGPPPAR